ncbi:RNA polymerase sigma factor SigM [Enhygromyxa salina]|uniref:RNA polymerase sigma factor SigM n=1 Tax=Enhygromyxa salina TaxID=215803 RepID=A0A2S9XEX3_9BACT|nr:RNA polymerase sigma factor [Enhygromyxa salina]PRP91414.1 RNA polymerase sigma factor SigM [Enhygromyxa salina]
MSATAPEPDRRDPRRTRDEIDHELFTAWRGGDRRAGNKLVNHYFSRVRLYFVARAAGEHEDLIQETFMRLQAKQANYANGSFRAYLFGIARLVFFEFLHHRYRLREIDPWTDSLSVISKGSFSSRLAAREDHRLLLDALGMLSLEDQDLLELHYWQRLTGRELALVFGVGEPTIRSRLGAARKRLIARFSEAAGKPHTNEYRFEDLEAWLIELRALLKRPTDTSDE